MPPLFHPDTSITPIPPLDDEFLLYSTDWSGGVRQFEEDVRAGRYASRFRVQAEKASRERAEGKLTKSAPTAKEDNPELPLERHETGESG
jgi:hypothetical protein